jgi:hypothetical protein
MDGGQFSERSVKLGRVKQGRAHHRVLTSLDVLQITTTLSSDIALDQGRAGSKRQCPLQVPRMHALAVREVGDRTRHAQ